MVCFRTSSSLHIMRFVHREGENIQEILPKISKYEQISLISNIIFLDFAYTQSRDWATLYVHSNALCTATCYEHVRKTFLVFDYPTTYSFGKLRRVGENHRLYCGRARQQTRNAWHFSISAQSCALPGDFYTYLNKK